MNNGSYNLCVPNGKISNLHTITYSGTYYLHILYFITMPMEDGSLIKLFKIYLHIFCILLRRESQGEQEYQQNLLYIGHCLYWSLGSVTSLMSKAKNKNKYTFLIFKGEQFEYTLTLFYFEQTRMIISNVVEVRNYQIY